jgi:hypothetical protein
MFETLAHIREAGRYVESERRQYGIAGERKFLAALDKSLKKRQFQPSQVSVRALAENFIWDRSGNPCGREYVDSCNPRSRNERTFIEAMGDAVNTSLFVNIMGQLTYTDVMTQFESVEYAATQAIPTVQASTQQAEVVPGFELLGDPAEDVGEAEEYPLIGFGEDWITVPKKVKDGFIVPLTKEVIWEDKTGEVLRRASSGAESMAITREKEAMDTLTGMVDTYRRQNGPVQATYGDTHTQGTFDNLIATNALADYTDIDAVRQQFGGFTDPQTGEPIWIGSQMTVIVPLALEATARNILNATMVQIGDTTATTPVTITPNPLTSLGQYTLLSTAYVYARTSSNSTWFAGRPDKAFEYREVWPVTVETADNTSAAAFHRDIVAMFKVSRKGVYYCKEPRYMCKCTA